MTDGNHARRHSHIGAQQRFGAPRWKRVLSSPVTIVLLVIILVLAARAAWGIYQKDRISAERLAQVEANAGKLRAQQTSLNQRIEYLSTDRGVEAELREKYRAVKDGESVAVVIDSADATSSAATSTPPVSWSRSFLQLFGF